MEFLRRCILRAMVIVGFPATYVMWWLIGGRHWHDDFWMSVRSMWRGERP
jgi:hypothetical protein